MVGSLNTIATRDFASAYGATGNAFLSDADLLKLQAQAEKDLMRFMEPAPQKPVPPQAPKPNPFLQPAAVVATAARTVAKPEPKPTPAKAEKSEAKPSFFAGLFAKKTDSWDARAV